MKYRDQLITLLRQRLGECADPADIVDELYSTGSLDETQASRYVFAGTFLIQYGNTDKKAKRVMEDIADELGSSRSSVYRAVQNLNPRRG